MTLLQAKTSSTDLRGGSAPLRTHRDGTAQFRPASIRVNPVALEATLTGTARVAHQFLIAANASDWSKVITGTDASPHRRWSTPFRPWTIEAIADAVGNAQERAIGIYPERQVRWLVIDIDRKPGSKSPYWDEHGLNLHLQALEAAIEAAGCQSVLIRSSNSGGLHLWALLPEMQPVHRVHHIGRELIERAGMTVKDGTCEVFPSEIRYRKGRPPGSKGVRLPGGRGSALLVDGALVTDPQTIWEELLAQLQNTEATPAWEALVADAEARVQEQFRGGCRRKSRYGKRAVSMPGPWTGRHQSMGIVEKITRVADAELAGSPDHVIVDRAVELIQQHEGFEQFASTVTKRRVRNGSWPQQWLDVWTRKGQRQAEDHPDRVRDPEHNQRLRGETMARLQAAVLEHGEELLSLSERAAAALLKVTRDTWRKVRNLVPDLLRSELVDTPPIKALDQNSQDQVSGCSGFESLDLAVSVPPVSSAESATVGVHFQEQERTDQNEFSASISSNLSRLRDQCAGLFQRKRKVFRDLRFSGSGGIKRDGYRQPYVEDRPPQNGLAARRAHNPKVARSTPISWLERGIHNPEVGRSDQPAQLVEHLHGMQGVRSSSAPLWGSGGRGEGPNPTLSTPIDPGENESAAPSPIDARPPRRRTVTVLTPEEKRARERAELEFADSDGSADWPRDDGFGSGVAGWPASPDRRDRRRTTGGDAAGCRRNPPEPERHPEFQCGRCTADRGGGAHPDRSGTRPDVVARVSAAGRRSPAVTESQQGSNRPGGRSGGRTHPDGSG